MHDKNTNPSRKHLSRWKSPWKDFTGSPALSMILDITTALLSAWSGEALLEETQHEPCSLLCPADLGLMRNRNNFYLSKVKSALQRVLCSAEMQPDSFSWPRPCLFIYSHENPHISGAVSPRRCKNNLGTFSVRELACFHRPGFVRILFLVTYLLLQHTAVPLTVSRLETGHSRRRMQGEETRIARERRDKDNGLPNGKKIMISSLTWLTRWL